MIELNSSTKLFLKDMGERAIKTFFQGVIAVIPTTAVLVQDVHWGMAFSAGALAAILSIFTSIVSRSIGDETSAGIVNQS